VDPRTFMTTLIANVPSLFLLPKAPMLLSLLPWLLKLLLPSLPWLPRSSVSCGYCDYFCYNYHQDSHCSYGDCSYPCYRGYLVCQCSLLAMVMRTRQKVFALWIFPVLSAFRHILNIATASSITFRCRPLSFGYPFNAERLIKTSRSEPFKN
jgi:hypothetical protein